MEEYPLSDWLRTPAEKQSCANSVVRCHPHVRKMIRFHLQYDVAPNRSHQVEITAHDFAGRLNIHLGPGSGHIRIDGAGPIHADIWMMRNSTFKIGAGSTINQAAFVIADADVEIGKDNLWSSEILVQASDQHGIVDLNDMSVINGHRRRIVFRDHVWVGRRVTVLPDLTVEFGSILGAAAVVTKDVPKFCIAVGNPAVVRRSGTTWSRRTNGLNDLEKTLLAGQKVPCPRGS